LGLGNPNSSLGGGGAKVLSFGSKEFSLAAKGSSVLSAHGANEGTKETNILASERLLNKGKLVAAAPGDPAPTSALQRHQARGSDGEASGERPQRSAPSSSHREVTMQSAKEAARAPDILSRFQVFSKTSFSLSRIIDPSSAISGKGEGSKLRGAIAEWRGATEELPAKEPISSKGLAARGKQSTTSATPLNTSQTTHPTYRAGQTAPTGVDHQGPSPVDPNIEVETEFPAEMVLEMQGTIAKKARRTVIGWTLGGRASFKALHECLKLHLPTSFASTTLLTRGYFLILFDSEEGVIATRKLTMVDWSGLSLSFSRFSPDFDASAQRAEALLTHIIKVQFPDLHEQFRNVKALTIMASKLGEVLDIEAEDSYIKRPAGPMVTLEVRDIFKLAGFIRIPSMSEGAGTKNSIRQRIFYSGLPNQCRKCRKFGHHARTCNTNLARPQEGPTHRNSPRRENSGGASAPKDLAQNVSSSIRPGPPPSVPTKLQKKKGVASRKDSPAAMESPQPPAQPSEGGNPDFGGSVQVVSSRIPDSKGMRDHEMSDLPEPITCPKAELHSEKEQGSACTPTVNIEAPLNLLAWEGSQRATWEATSNPFATQGKNSKEDPDLSEPPMEPTGGWIFQGRKRNTPTWVPTRQESPQALLHTPQREVTPGGKRGLLH